MPGIAGVISSMPHPRFTVLADRMIASMQHEPFYSANSYAAPEMGIYGGWVAHEGSTAANQPFVSDDGMLVALLSGELFQDRKSDHHPLIELYQEKGEDGFAELNGLFSGLLIDKRQGKAFLFNDRYGAERIYWHQTPDAFYFASEAKAILRLVPETRAFDLEGVAEFLKFGCTLGPRTLFRGIERIPAGSLWVFRGGECRKGRYFSPDEWEGQDVLSADSFQDCFRATFKRILPRYLTSSSRIGISLTAGIDSRMIMACLGAVTPPPVCYTFSGENRDPLDARIAGQVADALGLEHHTLHWGPDFFGEFDSNADRTVYLTDGTLGVLGTHELYFNRHARGLAPVRLTGVFGGEIMRGVSFFKALRSSTEFMQPSLRRLVAEVSTEELQSRKQHPISFAAFTETPLRRYGPPAAARSQLTFRTPYLDNEFVALCYRAPKPIPEALGTDPALHLISSNNPALASIPTDRGFVNGKRSFLRKLLAETTFKLDYFHTEGLPPRLAAFDRSFRVVNSALGIAGRYKFLHYRAWLQNELAGYVENRLANLSPGSESFWTASSARALFKAHQAGRANRLQELNGVLTLDAVERLLLNPPQTSEHAPANALIGRAAAG